MGIKEEHRGEGHENESNKRDREYLLRFKGHI